MSKTETCGCDLSDKEAKRIAWLTNHNLKSLGKGHHKAAEEIAIFQVAMEHAERHRRAHRDGEA